MTTEHSDVECLVAAILASSAPGSTGQSPASVVTKYRAMLKQLRESGGVMSDQNET